MNSSAFCMPRVPFVSDRLNGNSTTKQSLNYHSSDLDEVGQTAEWHLAVRLTFPKWPNGNPATVLSPNCHLVVETQTQTEPEVFRKPEFDQKIRSPSTRTQITILLLLLTCILVTTK